MAFSVSVSVYLLFNAMAALSEEVALNLTLAITTQPSNWTVNKTKGTEGPIALKFSHPCLEHHDSYCINGVCAFHRELKKAICRHTSYEISDCLLIRCRPHDGYPSISLPPERRLNYLTELIYPQD
ncbi:PREDICTED: epigen isoform X3 [Myotis brandtii]|uniref:epigen isoform X3 n=1 Tax=Myotis brandtii TaxID=109478 RepID=UPI000704081A|nr:PREDICTED: epigen isoform X3 [Myotis brandtii]